MLRGSSSGSLAHRGRAIGKFHIITSVIITGEGSSQPGSRGWPPLWLLEEPGQLGTVPCIPARGLLPQIALYNILQCLLWMKVFGLSKRSSRRGLAGSGHSGHSELPARDRNTGRSLHWGPGCHRQGDLDSQQRCQQGSESPLGFPAAGNHPSTPCSHSIMCLSCFPSHRGVATFLSKGAKSQRKSSIVNQEEADCWWNSWLSSPWSSVQSCPPHTELSEALVELIPPLMQFHTQNSKKITQNIPATRAASS